MPSNLIFKPSFGNKPDQIVGRDETLAQLSEGIQDYIGSAKRATLLVGQRGMGKTALLLELAELAKDAGYVTARVTCGSDMLENIIGLLQNEGSQFIREPKKPVKGFSAGAFGFSLGLTFNEQTKENAGFRIKLEMICDRLSQEGKRVLILVDEVEPSSSEMASLARTYQELVGEEKDIAIVMAGLPNAISELLNQKTLTFLNRARKIELEPVATQDVALYFSSAFTRANRKATQAIIQEAAKATEGFPYLLQLIGYYLVAYSSEGDSLTSEQLELAKSAAYAEMDEKVVGTILRQLSAGDTAFLSTMAEFGTEANIADVQARLEITQGAAQTYRRRLLDAGVIFSPKRGVVSFAIPRMAEYLVRQRQ